MTDWIARWQEGKTGWHKNQPNSRLIELSELAARQFFVENELCFQLKKVVNL